MQAPDKRKYADRAEYIKAAVKKHRKKIKDAIMEYLGGKCKACGYDKCIQALDFHHLDPSKKTLQMASGGLSRAWDVIRKELDHCILLCANCHREIHAGVTKLPSK